MAGAAARFDEVTSGAERLSLIENSVVVTIRTAQIGVGALLAVCLLTGCGGNGVAKAVRPGVPEGLDVDPANTAPAGTWLERGESFAIVTWGSSSCPLVASALTVEGADRIGVRFAPSPRDPCTADMAATTHEFALPVAVARTPVKVDVSYGDRDDIRTLTLN
ncbi:hypothetical protein D9V28_12855 [Mycetocola zhadangensis]|uniref:Uncharacterized protein n=1 Tax=Mycetocola zhadangensis TaxID=1164595 RepID=A0A3L7IT20_9MICO|nr:hypothetical protein D9V28_12855 [Mycetocola zhadangensis]GGF03295.1 hypothetical protein GCM10011313_28030 [Mycetocola zhadangensis]